MASEFEKVPGLNNTSDQYGGKVCSVANPIPSHRKPLPVPSIPQLGGQIQQTVVTYGNVGDPLPAKSIVLKSNIPKVMDEGTALTYLSQQSQKKVQEVYKKDKQYHICDTFCQDC